MAIIMVKLMAETIDWVARMELFNLLPGHFGLKLSQSSLVIQPFPFKVIGSPTTTFEGGSQ